MLTTARGKERQRYILVHYFLFHVENTNGKQDHPSTLITDKQLWKTISRTHSALHGDIKSALAGLYIMTHDPSCRLFILRTSLQALDDVITSLTMITKINGIPGVMWPFKISGTLKKCKKIMKKSYSQIIRINQQLKKVTKEIATNQASFLEESKER